VDTGVANTSYFITQNIRIAGNCMWGAGVPGDVHEHTTYTESEGIVIEKDGTLGSAIHYGGDHFDS
jgi:hypothetical protein